MGAAFAVREQTTPSAAIAEENLYCLFTLGLPKPSKEDAGLVALARPRVVKLFWPLFNSEIFIQFFLIIR